MSEPPKETSAHSFSHANWWLLEVVSAGVVLGAVLRTSSAATSGNVTWIVVALLGVGISMRSVIDGVRRHQLGVDVIALLALVGALAVKEYLAGAIIALMLATGQALEDWASGRARRELEALLSRAPKSAHRYEGGELLTVSLGEINPGDRLMVASGELVPVDGTLDSPSAVLDESALTGEALPVTRRTGEHLRSGVVNAGDPFDLHATTNDAESTYSNIVRLVAQAQNTPAPFLRMADRFALGFLFVTLASAGVAWGIGGATRAVAVLVVATPCPMILAAPVAFVAGLSRAAKRGVIVKSGAVLERLAGSETLLIDKTGTVTSGRPELVEVVTTHARASRELLYYAASLDQMSPHVVAESVVRAALDQGAVLVFPTDVQEVAGRGISGNVNGARVLVGNAQWAGVLGSPSWAKPVRRRAERGGALTVYVSLDGEPAGLLVFEDPPRPDAARTIRAVRRSGVRRVVLVTGDRLDVAETIGAVIGADEVLAERSPQEKLDVVRRESERASTIMVGDGINDAPALALAHVGVAMGARGVSAASEAADVVLTLDRLDRLSEAINLARRTRRIATQSVVAGMAMSLLAMGAALVGWLPAVAGALLQELIDAAVIINALRALGAGSASTALSGDDAALTRRFRDEHRAVRDVINQLAQVADGLDRREPAQAIEGLRSVHRQLVDEVLPHEEAEETYLYPTIDRFLGGNDPTGTMSRAHVEIAHRIRRLGRLLEEIDTASIDETDVTELRGVLYGLQSILALHTAQEEESYLSLAEEV